jgi:hypothetical protein
LVISHVSTTDFAVFHAVREKEKPTAVGPLGRNNSSSPFVTFKEIQQIMTLSCQENTNNKCPNDFHLQLITHFNSELTRMLTFGENRLWLTFKLSTK